MLTSSRILIAAALLSAGTLHAADLVAGSSAELRAALSQLRPGDRLRLKSGTYAGNFSAANLQGTEAAPIVIEGLDPADPPVFGGGALAFQFSSATHLTLRHLIVRGCTGNGINLDDGGKKDSSARFITVEHVMIEDTGPRGNRDALKLSGLDDFTVAHCVFRGWGGSGIDMVGCHRGVIRDCLFEGKAGFEQANAVQMKGGSSAIHVRGNTFLHAGQRAINIGGSTGLEFFRPPGAVFEASGVEVSENRFTGSLAPIAWVNADGGHVHHNTIHHPEKWVARILQESTGERFQPSQGGIFEHNLIVFDRRVNVFVNVGPGTAPETFVFRRNAWFRSDGPTRPPVLPTPEQDGVYGIDPKLEQPGTARMRTGSTAPELKGIGAP